jgi:murein DD-endopeptidase MepM/ murein hydrolase activator NlpD
MPRDYRFKWPLANNTIPGPRSLFGMVRDNGRRPHHGWDLRAMTGTPCYATAGGTVVSIGEKTGYGRTLDIHLDHMINGLAVYLRLAHLSKVADGISEGTRVGQGELVCYTGNSGSSSTGPHLHFEYMKRANPSPGESGLFHRYDPAIIYGDVTPGQVHCEPCTGG